MELQYPIEVRGTWPSIYSSYECGHFWFRNLMMRTGSYSEVGLLRMLPNMRQKCVTQYVFTELIASSHYDHGGQIPSKQWNCISPVPTLLMGAANCSLKTMKLNTFEMAMNIISCETKSMPLSENAPIDNMPPPRVNSFSRARKSSLKVKTLNESLRSTWESSINLPKNVYWKEVHIRLYERVVGDNPSCSSGPPMRWVNESISFIALTPEVSLTRILSVTII